jgi:hypothetical protein
LDINIDKGPPALAVCGSAPSEEERAAWVSQLQVPMIYQDDDNQFSLIYRNQAGELGIQALPGSASPAAAAADARRYLAENTGSALVDDVNSKWNEYNQRQSGNLMNVVAVIYGVALAVALSNRPSLLLRPMTTANIIPSLALLAAGLLTAYAFYSYVLSVGGDRPYIVAWTLKSSQWGGIFRFFTDLVLAVLYVHLLFAAVRIKAGRATAPSLDGLMFAFILVFLGAVLVWWVRGLGPHWVAIFATLISIGLWSWAYFGTATRDFDLFLEAVVLIALIGYGGVNHWVPYHAWHDNEAASEPPRRCQYNRPKTSRAHHRPSFRPAWVTRRHQR